MNMHALRAFVLGVALVGAALAPANAQTPTPLCIPDGTSGQKTCSPVISTNPLPVTGYAGQYPAGATPLTGNATGTTGAVVGTLAKATGKTTYICGFNVSAIGGTAAVGPITVAGLITSSMVYELASSAAGVTLSVPFVPCIPASGTNVDITVTTTADGSASAVAVNSWGFRQ